MPAYAHLLRGTHTREAVAHLSDLTDVVQRPPVGDRCTGARQSTEAAVHQILNFPLNYTSANTWEIYTLTKLGYFMVLLP